MELRLSVDAPQKYFSSALSSLAPYQGKKNLAPRIANYAGEPFRFLDHHEFQLLKKS